MSGWTELVGWLVVPWLLSTLVKWWNSSRASATKQQQQQAKSKVRPWARIDTLTTLWFVGCGLFHLGSGRWNAPPNLLQEMGSISPEAPAYVLRNAFRGYMSNRFDGWVMGDVNSPKFDAATNAQIDQMEWLYDRLRSVSGRKRYLQYGHDSFTTCTWCKEDSDFALHALPSISMSYVAMLGALGLGTVSLRKRHWRGWGLLILMAFGALDLYFLFFPSDLPSSLVDQEGEPAFSQYVQMHKLRHYVLGLLCLVGAFWNANTPPDLKDTVQGIIAMQQLAFNRMNASRLAKAATLSDGTLRKAFFDFYKEKEAQNEAMIRDVEFLETKRKTLAKFNLPALVDSVRNMTDSILRTALDHGFLQGVELPPMSMEELVQSQAPETPLPAAPTASSNGGARRRA